MTQDQELDDLSQKDWLEWTLLEELAEEIKRVGIEARSVASEPRSGEKRAVWLELQSSPIRWIQIENRDVYYDLIVMHGWIPTSRTDLGRMKLVPKEIRSFPVFGRVKAVRWKPPNGMPIGDDRSNLHVARHLDKGRGTESFFESVGFDPSRSSWWISAFWYSIQVGEIPDQYKNRVRDAPENAFDLFLWQPILSLANTLVETPKMIKFQS